MADLRSKLSLDGSDFNKTLDDATRSVNDFNKETQGANKAVGDMGNTTKRTASELLKEMKNMEGLGRSTSNYRQQLGQMTRQIMDLTVNYRAMSDEMKNSEFGREVAAQIQDLTAKASQYKDAIQDATSNVRLLSSDTANLDAAKSAIDGLSAGMQVFASMGILGEQSTEKVVKMLAKLKAIESATNAVIKIANVLNKDSILMLKLKELATASNTIETTKNTAAQIANNAANTSGISTGTKLTNVIKNLTKAMKTSKIAKAGLAAAIVLVIAKIVKWNEATREQIAMERKLDYMTDEEKEKVKAYAESISTSMAKAAGSFDRLKEAYEACNSYSDRVKFLEDYKKELETLGLRADDVNKLEDIFINKTDEYKKAVLLRAQFLALQAEAQKAYQEAFVKVSTGFASQGTKKEGDIIEGFKEQFDLKGLAEGIDYEVISNEYGKIIAKLTKQGAADWNQYFVEAGADFGEIAADAARQPFDDITEVLKEKAKALGIDINEIIGGGGGGGTSGPTYENGSVADYEAQIASLNKRLKEEKLTYAEIQQILKDIIVLEAQRDIAANGGLMPSLTPKTYEKAIDELRKKQTSSTLKLNVGLDIDTKTIFDLNKKISDTVSSLGSMNSAVASIGNALEEMNDGWDNTKTDIENITSIVGNFLTILQAITSVIETINTLSKIWTGLSLSEWMIQKRKNAALMEGLGIETAETGVKSTNAALAAAEAGSEVAGSAAKIPLVGWVLAIGALATFIALIASAKSAAKFAQGGIVPGSSFSGDKIHAQLNSGEMVLNTTQQARLFRMLDGGAGGFSSGQVEFVLHGQELVGLYKNYNNKMSRI